MYVFKNFWVCYMVVIEVLREFMLGWIVGKMFFIRVG